MSRWWRAEDTSIDHPKLLRLSDAMHRAWYTLMCVASANGGVLPPTADIALRLRMKPTKVAEWITALVAGGLFDRHADGTFSPHNWDKRQYKTDSSDPTGAARAKRYRDRKRDDRDASRRDDRDATVRSKRPETDTETEDRMVDARASRSVFTEGSKALTDAFWQAIGCSSPLEVSPDYAGVDWRAIEWEKAGWTVDLIEAETKRVGPGKPLNYYEKVFATAFARRQAPLPVVNVKEGVTIDVQADRRAKPENLCDVAKRHIASGIAFGPKPTGLPPRPTAGNPQGPQPLRLLPQG